MRLSKHQKRVLAALLALEQEHTWSWWGRYAIGEVVDAGGFHQVIQVKTIAILKEAELICTQRSTWSEEMRAEVACNCAAWLWGLTEAGRSWALLLNAKWDDETRKRIAKLRWAAGPQRHWGDEGEGPDDDDDGPRDPTPAPMCPGDLVLA